MIRSSLKQRAIWPSASFEKAAKPLRNALPTVIVSQPPATPKPIALNILVSAYNEELENFKKNTEAADKFLAVGESKRDESINNAEHAAWTIVASMLLNLDEVITRL